MTLEERITRLAEKGELTHLSLAFYDGLYHAKFAAASGAGYAGAEHADPVVALVGALSAVKVRTTHLRAADPNLYGSGDVTAAVINEEKTTLPQDWTAP